MAGSAIIVLFDSIQRPGTKATFIDEFAVRNVVLIQVVLVEIGSPTYIVRIQVVFCWEGEWRK